MDLRYNYILSLNDAFYYLHHDILNKYNVIFILHGKESNKERIERLLETQ